MICLKPIRLPKDLPGRELFKPRPRTRETMAAVERIYESKDGRFRVVCSQIKYGNAERGRHYAPRWWVICRLDGTVCIEDQIGGWHFLPAGDFRTAKAAFAAAKKAIEEAGK